MLLKRVKLSTFFVENVHIRSSRVQQVGIKYSMHNQLLYVICYCACSCGCGI